MVAHVARQRTFVNGWHPVPMDQQKRSPTLLHQQIVGLRSYGLFYRSSFTAFFTSGSPSSNRVT